MSTPSFEHSFVTNPLCDHIGLEIRKLDVRRVVQEDEVAHLKRLLFRNQLLCFRDQVLEPNDLMSFTKLFGAPDPHVLEQFTLENFRDIFVLSNIVENGKPLGSTMDGFGWHTDLTYLARPAAYTILYGITVPPEGADTLFASMYKAYDSLDEGERRILRQKKGIYSYAKLYGRRENAPPLTEAQRARTPDVVHPLVRMHPHTQREGMYINLDDCIGIEGMAQDEALALIKKLFDFTIDNFSYRHKWAARDLLIWDNRGALHSATPYDMNRHKRLVYRTTVMGERPIAA